MTPEVITAIAATATAIISLLGFGSTVLALVFFYGKLTQKVTALDNRVGRLEKWTDSVSLVYLEHTQQAHVEGDD